MRTREILQVYHVRQTVKNVGGENLDNVKV